MQRHFTFTLILVRALLVQPLLAAIPVSVALPLAETNQPRTRCVSLAGTDSHLYFTRYWADVLPGAMCAFYRIPRGMTGSGDWTALASAPKYVQEPPAWFTTNLMQSWGGNGMSVGDVAGQPFVFMFGSIAKGGTGEDIGRDLLGYNIGGDAWEIVTNRYAGDGTDAACTFVASNSIYGFWTGWTAMQRWTWDKNSLGVVQQADSIGAAALHPVAGARVGNLGVTVMFQSGLNSAKLLANTADTINNQTISTALPWNVGMGCAMQHVPAAYTLSGLDELWILRGGSGPNTGDGQANNTPNADVLVLAFTNTPTSISIVAQRRITLPYLTGAVGSSMACVSNLMYFLRYNGAINPELYALPTTYQAQDPPSTPWPLNGNNKQRQGWYTNGWVMTGGKIMWTNQTQAGSGIYGSGVTDGQRFYLPVDAAPGNNNKELLAIDVNGGTNVWAIDLADWANGTPALSQDRVYVGDHASYVYAINKLTGAIIWSNNLGAGSCNGGVLLTDNRIYIEADGNAGGTFCLDADSGAVLWHNNAPTNAGTWSGNGPSLSPDGAAVYVHTEGDLGGQMFAMDALTGSTLWYRVYASGWGGQEPIVDNAGNIYCAFDGVATPAGNDVLISFKPNGTTNWIYDLGMHDAWHHGGYALSPDGATIYCSRRSGGGATGIGLTAVNTATGTKKWDAACGDTGGGCVVGAGNLILGVFQTATGRAVKAIRDNGASGDVLWSTQIAASGDTWTWPTLLPNGDVIAMSEYVIAHITLPTPAPPIGWCNLQWPYALLVVSTSGPGVSDKVFGQVRIDGVTSQPGPTPGLKAWLGYGPTNALPNAPSWQWTPADFNVQVGDGDEFYTNFVIAPSVPAGVYAYCYYYEYQTNDVPSTGYGQIDGGPRTPATYNPAQSGLLTILSISVAPFVDVTSTPVTVTYDTTSYTISGTNNINVVGTLRWSNTATLVSGTLPAALGWSIGGIGLAVGANSIVVYGTNAFGAVSSDSVTITRGGIGTGAPFVDVTNQNASFSYDVTQYSLSGTNNVHVVGGMWWTNSRGGSGKFNAAAAWAITNIQLGVGDNIIAVSGTNQLGVATNDNVTLTRIPGTGTPFLDVTSTPVIVIYNIARYDVAGTNNANVIGTMAWTNKTTGGNGTLAAAASWRIPTITLAVGANEIVVSGTNLLDATASDSVTITRGGTATATPYVDVTNANRTVIYNIVSTSIGGSNNIGVVALWWSNSLTSAGGALSPGSPWWTINNIALNLGANVITVYGTNGLNVATSDSVTITRINTQIELMSPVDNYLTNQFTIGFNVAYGDAIVYHYMATNSVPVFDAPQMFPYTNIITFSSTGTIYWTALGYDSSFNVYWASATNRLTVYRNTKITLHTPVNGYLTNGSTVNFNVTYGEGLQSNYLVTNSVPVFDPAKKFPYSASLPISGTGTYYWTAVGLDSNMNLFWASSTNRFTIQKTLIPGVHLVAPLSGTRLTNVFACKLTVDYGAATLDRQLSINAGASWYAYDAENPVVFNNIGMYQWTARGRSAAGWWYAPETNTLIVTTNYSGDRAIFLLEPADGRVTTNSALDFRVQTYGSPFTFAQVSIDNGAFVTVPFPTNIALPVGQHQWTACGGVLPGPVYTYAPATNVFWIVPEDYKPSVVCITSSVNMVSYDVTNAVLAGTNTSEIVGGMWVQNASSGGAVITFSRSGLAFTTPPAALTVGSNVIVVYGTNVYAVPASDSITITRGPAGTGMPLVDMTNNSVTVSYDATTYTVGGTNNINVVGTLRWSNTATLVSGTLPAALGWSIGGIGLAVGANSIVVYGTNAFGAVSSDSVTITRGGIGTGAPFVDITNATPPVLSYDVTSYTLGITNNMHVVGTRRWANALTSESGVLVNNQATIPLGVGANEITVTGTNEWNVSGSDSITVTRGGIGTGAPYVDITNAAISVVGYASATTAIGGTNNENVIGMIRWQNLTGGTAGDATRVGDAWTALITGLLHGDNTVQASGTNLLAQQNSDSIVVHRKTAAEAMPQIASNVLIFPSPGAVLPAPLPTNVIWRVDGITDDEDGTNVTISCISVHVSNTLAQAAVVTNTIGNLVGLCSWLVPESLAGGGTTYVVRFEVTDSSGLTNSMVFNGNAFTIVPEGASAVVAALVLVSMAARKRQRHLTTVSRR